MSDYQIIVGLKNAILEIEAENARLRAVLKESVHCEICGPRASAALGETRSMTDEAQARRIADQIARRKMADEIERLQANKRRQAEDIMTLGQEVGRLQAALQQYGDHTYECTMKDDNTCNCGYSAALGLERRQHLQLRVFGASHIA